MTKINSIRDFFPLVAAAYGGNPGKWKFYFDYIFDSVSLVDKTVLDVGGGIGSFSYYAACMGARKVVCLEPGLEGGGCKMLELGREFSSQFLHIKNVAYERTTFQQFDPKGEKFDVILLHNSINHLDEKSCMLLHREEKARRIYSVLFNKMSMLVNLSGKLIVSDCSRHNFFATVGIRNPFAPDIEWEKHQPPTLWASLLSQWGFGNPIIQWSAPSRLGSWGRHLLGNSLFAYLYTSHFCLTMEKIVRPG